jgi:two-component system, OmpR family, phosphate regulon sensor histidine kinase PhoR
MNKKKFLGLIFMMLFSILMIIWVQITWIRNAVGVRNDSFDYAVNTSLGNAANAMESSRKMNFFNNFLITDPAPAYGQKEDFTGSITIGSTAFQDGSNLSVRITSQSVRSTPGTKPLIITHDTTITSDSTTFIMTTPEEPGKMSIVKKGEVSMSNPEAIFINQQEFIDWVKKRSGEFQNMSQQMISEVYQWEKAFKLDNKEIEYNLKQYFLFSNIQTPFEYAIIKDGVVQEGNFKKAVKNDFLKSKYMVRLFSDNIIRQDIVLSVIFPERTNYILGSMAWILGGSLLFSLIIFATFALSLYFIIRQKKISEMKSDFINNMTHEFKTPIATISLAADTITNPKVIKDESSVRHFISMIKKENSRMNNKVETILQIASLDKKEIDFRFENNSIHSIIEKVIDTIEIQVQQRNGRIKLSLKAAEPVIYGDSEHLGNLVNNLLDNAIKYSPGAPEITVETKNNEKGVILSVEDKGIGMSKNVQGKIFERFYRQNRGDVHDVKGFGLGLNYVHAIIDAHKGTIDVSSEPGKGSRFDIFLPFNWEN